MGGNKQMKNYKISSGQIPHLVRVAADLFRTMNDEIKYSPDKSTQMHFVADLLKDLVDTAYPTEEKRRGTTLDKQVYEEFRESMLENGLSVFLIPAFEDWRRIMAANEWNDLVDNVFKKGEK